MRTSTGTSTGTVRIAVIGGGANCEHEVSLASAASVADALAARGYDVVRLTIDPDGWWLDATGALIGLAGSIDLLRSTDLVIPVVHGPHGEDGTLAALCDLAGVAYVGSGLGAGALAMDKWATKLIAQAIGISTAAGIVLTRRNAAAYGFEGPVVVKPIAAGSSHGVSLVTEADALRPALEAALALDERVLVEEVVRGREIDVAVLGTSGGDRRASPPLEIVTDGLFDFDAKYGGGADFRVPAVLADAERKALEEAAFAMYDALGCAGVARIDFFWTSDGPVLNEVNTMPGFTEHSQVPRMFAAAGISYGELLEILVRDALSVAPRDRTARHGPMTP